jgi:plasmid stability protein
MTNLTISLEPEIVKAARLRAIEEGTSVSAQVREYLKRYAQREITLEPLADTKETASEFLTRIAQADGVQRTMLPWSRDALYDRELRK